MDLLNALFLVLIGICAGFVQRVCGFGLGIFAMIFLPYFLPPRTAAAISTLLSFITTTYNSVRFRKNIEYKTTIPMISAALVSIPIAVHFSSIVSAEIFDILLGAVLIILSLYFIFFNKRIKIKPNIKNGIFAGALGGILGGLFSTGGPPAVLYLNSTTTDNITYFATVQFYFCLTTLYTTISRAANGIITKEVLIYAAIGVVGCFIGNVIGKKVFDKLDSNKLKYIIYFGMIISGAVMLF